ncbi:uncharacterized protein METZ01_LOCUS210710 [marine metagenome]|uniref:H-NS histone family protein n=1 Tax=marine metagenome TaxID=408172 RepID=A0A382F4A6_9ZZZZ
MKSYDELKAEMANLQQQMVEAKQEERKAVIKQVRNLCKEFKITAGHLKGALAQGRKSNP